VQPTALRTGEGKTDAPGSRKHARALCGRAHSKTDGRARCYDAFSAVSHFSFVEETTTFKRPLGSSATPFHRLISPHLTRLPAVFPATSPCGSLAGSACGSGRTRRAAAAPQSPHTARLCSRIGLSTPLLHIKLTAPLSSTRPVRRPVEPYAPTRAHSRHAHNHAAAVRAVRTAQDSAKRV
jgi:hypothetical protein